MIHEVYFDGGPHNGKLAKCKLAILKPGFAYNIGGATYELADGPVLQAAIKGGPVPNAALRMTFKETAREEIKQ